MTEAKTANAYLAEGVSKSDRILLVNPPVIDTRYSWLRWNQPMDLFAISHQVRSHAECKLQLLDFMQPDSSGAVQKQSLPAGRRYEAVGIGEYGYEYPMWRFGKPFTDFEEWCQKQKLLGRNRLPTQVWITSLCSYWHQSVAEMCRVVLNCLPKARVVLLGRYPQLMPDHAMNFSGAHVAITKAASSKAFALDSDLYGSCTPNFLAVPLHLKSAVAAISDAHAKGITRFTFFEDDLCSDGGRVLASIFKATESLAPSIRFHLICGLYADRVTPAIAKLLADRRVAEMHFEETVNGSELNTKAYDDCRAHLADAGIDIVAGQRTSGFVWIGRPGETLDEIVRRTFVVLRACGGVILKPYSPTPGSPEHAKHREYLDQLAYAHWGPHFFPFAELNGITRQEYHDLYRMAAFLNERVRSRAFDLFDSSICADLLRESLRRETWKIEPNALRTLN